MSRTDHPDESFPPEVSDLIAEARKADREARRDGARFLYQAALMRLRGSGETSLASALLRWTGRSYLESGDLEAAFDCLDAALASAEAAGDVTSQAHAVNCQAIGEQMRGDIDEAERLYTWARDRAAESGEDKLVAMTEQNLGIIANIRGEFRVALARYQASLDAYRRLGLEEYVGPLLNNIGRLQTDLKHWDEADATFAEAYESCRLAERPSYQVLIEVNRTRLRIARRDFQQARESCDAAYELTSAIRDERWLGQIYQYYGVVYRETGKLQLASEHLERAEEFAKRQHDAILAAETVRELAEVHRLGNRNRETLQCLNRAHRLFSELRARRDVADLDERIAQLERSFLEIVREWGESIESKDTYTQGHCRRVAEHASRLAEAAGFDRKTLIWFRMGALLHDVGKVVVPSEILKKNGRLTPTEWAIMRQHPEAGERLLAEVGFPWDIGPMVRHHHERWDGHGYPDHLSGDEIPWAARILCVADVYDALTTDRAYRAAFTHDQALGIMQDEEGRIFDPELLAVFVKLVRHGPPPTRELSPYSTIRHHRKTATGPSPW